MLRDLGAVPFCLTNVPQTMKSFGCSNPIFGETKHPQDDSRTPGGSSGGEACLMALGGSILGIGTDVGGSLRTPAVFCGVAGIKPTTGRLFNRGRRTGAIVSFVLMLIYARTYKVAPFQGQTNWYTIRGCFLGANSRRCHHWNEGVLENCTQMVQLEPNCGSCSLE